MNGFIDYLFSSSMLSSEVYLSTDEIDDTKRIHEDENSNSFKLKDNINEKYYSVTIPKCTLCHFNIEQKTELKAQIDELQKLKHLAIQQFYGICSTNKNQQRTSLLIQNNNQKSPIFAVLFVI